MIAAREREVAIETPEGVRFALTLAGPATRFLAWVIDMLVISAAFSAVSQAVRVVHAWSPGVMAALSIIAYFVISIGYGMAFEWYWRGRTIGKRVMRLRVLDAQGFQLDFSQIAIRNLLRFADMLPAFYLVGGAAMLLTRDAQRLGDMAANTVVIRERSSAEADSAPWMAGRYNSLLEHPHLAARLRQKLSPQLAAIAYDALARRDEMEPAARIEVFRAIAEQLRTLVSFPEETTEGLTDEQYVRSALNVVMR